MSASSKRASTDDRPVTLVVGSAILTVILGVSLLGPWISPYAATEQHILKRLERPSWTYLLGTDQYGRDLLSRTLMGGRTALLLGVGAVLVGLAFGLPVGLAAGYHGGRVDDTLVNNRARRVLTPTGPLRGIKLPLTRVER